MASNDARIQISENNAQMRYQAEVQSAENKDTARTNRYNAFTLATNQISALVEGKVEENSEENVRAYQLALQDAIMSGKFEYKDMNPDNGLAESWEDYWGNYQSFTEQWLGNNENVKGGILSKASTKRAVNNYLNNSMTDIADSRKTQLWEQKVATRQNIQASLLSGVFDEEEYKSNFASLIANDKLATKGVVSMDGLSTITDYGINDYYEEYVLQKTLFDNGQDSNYFEAALNLQIAMRAYVGDWGQDYFKTYMAGSEKAEGATTFNLIQATHATAEGLKDALISLCNSTGGSAVSLQEFIESNKIGSFIKGQNGQYIRTDGLTEKEITSANSQLTTELTKIWTQLSAQNAEMFTDFYSDMTSSMAESNGPIFYSIEDIINYKDLNSEKYGSLSDEYVKYQVKKNDKLMSMMKENSIKKENLDAIYVLGNAQENWNNWTEEEQRAYETEMEAARNTLWKNNYWAYASGYFNFGTSYDVGDDTGSWRNETTGAVFEYMKAYDVDFVTAALKSGFYDNVLSTASVAGTSAEAGSFLPAWTIDTGRYMDNNASAFFTAAFNTDDILSHSYTKKEIEEKFPTEADRVKEAARLIGVDVESSETGYNNLVDAYKLAEEMVSIGGNVIRDEETLKAVYLNKVTGLNQNKTDKEKSAAVESSISYTKSLLYALYPEEINLGNMLKDASIDGSTAYNRDAIVYAVKTEVASQLSAIKNSGTKEDAENLCMLYGNKDLYVALKKTDDWKSIIDDDFVGELTNSRCNTSLNFYNSFAGDIDISQVDYMTSTGTTDTIKGTIETNCKDVYLNASEAWLRMQYQTNPAATYGKDYNGVKVAGTSIVEDGSIGSDMFKTYAARVAFATSEADKQQALSEAKGFLCEDALKVLQSSDSINIALQSLGIFGADTVQSIIGREYGSSEFGRLQEDDEYTDFAKYLGTSTEFFAKIKEAKSRLDANEPEATVMADVIDYLQNCATDYCIYSNEDKIKATEKARNKEAGVNFTVIGSLEEFSSQKKDDKKADSAHTLFSNLTSNSSKLSSQYFAGDITTRSHIDKLFVSGGLNANENQASLYNLAVGISGGNVASTDKNALALVCSIMAYNQITGSNFQIDATKLTSANIKIYEEELASYLSESLSTTQQYDWSRLQSSINTIVKTVSKYEAYGFDDVLSYATNADGGFGFVSNKSSKITINSDGTIALKLPEEKGGQVIQDISLYSDGPNRNSVAVSLFGSENVVKGYITTPPAIKDFDSNDGLKTVNDYNETKEYLDGKSSNDAILVAYPVGIRVTNGKISFVIERENAYSNDNPNYYLHQMTLDTATNLYDFYIDNGLTDKADELCSMLTSTQAKAIKTKSKEKAEAKEKAKEISSTTVGETEKVDVVAEIDSDAFRSARKYAQDNPKIGVSNLYQHLKSIDNEADFEDTVQGFVYEAQASNFLKDKVDDPVAVINGYADDIRKKNWTQEDSTEDAGKVTTRVSESGIKKGGAGKSFADEANSSESSSRSVESSTFEATSSWAKDNPSPSKDQIRRLINNAEDIDSVYYDLLALADEGVITLPAGEETTGKEYLYNIVNFVKARKGK